MTDRPSRAVRATFMAFNVAIVVALVVMDLNFIASLAPGLGAPNPWGLVVGGPPSSMENPIMMVLFAAMLNGIALWNVVGQVRKERDWWVAENRGEAAE